MIRFKNANLLSKEEICRIQFNTSFITGNYISAGKLQLSPEDLRKNKQVPDELQVDLQLEPICKICHPQITEINELCNACRGAIGDDVIGNWTIIKGIIDNHSVLSY